ncbi:hypothetical protein ACLMJK_008080 [Lecanora helva]
MIANAKAGPPPIPPKLLDSRILADAIALCLRAENAKAAGDIANKMRDEKGVRDAVASFHRKLPRDRMMCEAVPGRSADWLFTHCKYPIRLSNLAVENLLLAKDVRFGRKHLKHYGPSPIIIKNKRSDPVTSASSAGLRLTSDITASTVGMFTDPVKVYLDNHKTGSEGKSRLKVHGKAAIVSVKSIDHLAVGAFKGGMVDIPPLAEEFRNVPRLLSQDVSEQREITGWKSGAAVAGKPFVHGFYDGVGGFFYRSYKGAKDEGALGFAKGCGKGLTGIIQ